MEKKEYIERNKLIDDILHALLCVPCEEFLLPPEKDIVRMIKSEPVADIVPWSWLEQYAAGKRCNFASEFVSEARKEWENGTADKNV